MQTTTKIILLLLLIFGFYVPAVKAELITINLTATVNYIDGAGVFGGAISVGSTITGSYVYESTTEDSKPETWGGDYWHYTSPAGVSLTVGGFEFKTDPTNVAFLMVIRDNVPNDIYCFDSYNNLPLPNGTSVTSLWWQLNDNTHTALSSDALPTTAPILNQWQYNNELHIDGGGTEGSYYIRATVDSVDLVPEPGTLLLLTLGALAIKRRRHFQN